jgi:hypothetical protein
VLVNGKTGSRHIPLSIPHVKDYLDHEHPQPSNPNAPFICGLGKSLGRAIGERSLFKIYDNYKKKHFPNLVENPNIPQEDKNKVRELLKKPWNPYIRINREVVYVKITCPKSIRWLEPRICNVSKISTLFW